MDEDFQVYLWKTCFDGHYGTVEADEGIYPLGLGVEHPNDSVNIVEDASDVERQFEKIELAGGIIDNEG